MVYDSYIVRRTQIYLDQRQADELSRRAVAGRTTASKMIREAIDQYLADPDDTGERLARYRAALDGAFGVAPHLGEGAAYVERLRAADRARDRELAEPRSR